MWKGKAYMGESGSAHNDVIWEKILPSLQLATTLLVNASKMPWIRYSFPQVR